MFGRGQRVLVAASGGPDSTALLALLVELAPALGIEVIAAHLNHQLRGAEAQADAQFVAELCTRFGVRLVSAVTPEFTTRGNLEARARQDRYEFLRRAAAEEGAAAIATGHTLDDQAETVLLRLLRGAGSRGLAGILPVAGGLIVRPLLDCSRQLVHGYLAERGLGFCSDSSNDDRSFTRNRIRHDLLPVIEQINPAYRQTLARTAKIARAESALIDRYAKQLLDSAGELSLPSLQGHDSLAPAVLRAWLERERGSLVGITARHLVALSELARSRSPSGVLELPDGGRVARRYQKLVFERAAHEQRLAPMALRPGTKQELARWQFESALGAPQMYSDARSRWLFRADADCLRGELMLRPSAHGDRIVPFGSAHRRKLQDVFVDGKIPRSERWGRPLLEHQGEILWVPGVIRGAGAPVASHTRRVLFIAARDVSIAGP